MMGGTNASRAPASRTRALRRGGGASRLIIIVIGLGMLIVTFYYYGLKPTHAATGKVPLVAAPHAVDGRGAAALKEVSARPAAVGGALTSPSCWCPAGGDEMLQLGGVAHAALISWGVANPSAGGPAVSPLLAHPTSRRLDGIVARAEGGSGGGSASPVTMHVYRGPCDTYHRQMKEYGLREGDVRHVGYLRGRFETCARDVKSPQSLLPFAGQRDVRADIVPSCAERTALLQEEVDDYWESAGLPAHQNARVSSAATRVGDLLSTFIPTRCACEGGAEGFALPSAGSEAALNAMVADAVKAAGDACGKGDMPCVSSRMIAAAIARSEGDVPAVEGDAVVPRPAAGVALTDPSALGHPSRDALCRTAHTQASENPSIVLLPEEETVMGKGTPRSGIQWHMPSFDDVAVNSHSPLKTLQRLIIAANASSDTQALWGSVWRSFARCEECQVTELSLGDLTDAENTRRLAIEASLMMGATTSLLAAEVSVDAVRKAVAQSGVSLADLRWYGQRVVLALNDGEFAASYARQIAEGAAYSARLFPALADSKAFADASHRAAVGVNPAGVPTIVLPASGVAGRTLAKQAALLSGAPVDPSLLHQDNAERSVGTNLYAKIANKQRIKLQREAASEGKKGGSGRAMQSALDAPPAPLAGTTTSTAGGQGRSVDFAALQLGAVASALALEGADAGHGAPTPLMAAAVFGDQYASKADVGSLPYVAGFNMAASMAAYNAKGASAYQAQSTDMRRDEVAMDFCLARYSKETAKKATGGNASIPSLRKSLFVNTVNGAMLVCYDGNDVVCDTVKSQGVWEPHLHALLRAAVLRIRSEVRIAATILKEREAVLAAGAPKDALADRLKGEAAEGGPLAAWHSAAAAYEGKAPRTASTLSGLVAGVDTKTVGTYDRFAYFLRPTSDQRPVSISPSTDKVKSTRIPEDQLAWLSDGDAMAVADQAQGTASFIAMWSQLSVAFQGRHNYSVHSDTLPEVFDRRVDLEFVTEDAMNSLKHLSRMARPTAAKVAGGDAPSSYAERPIVPELLLPAKDGSVRVRRDRTLYDEDVLFMDAGANVGSFAFDVRVGGSVNPSPASAGYIRAREDAAIHMNGVIDGASVTNLMLLEALPANIFLLETTRCLNNVREFSTWRAAVAKVAGLFDKLRCVVDGKEGCATSVTTRFSPSISGAAAGERFDWTDVPAQVTAPDFKAVVEVVSTFGDAKGASLALAHHHVLLSQYLGTIGSCVPETVTAAHQYTTTITCRPPRWEPSLHHVALGDRDSFGGDTWCVLTSDFGNLADTLLTCDPAEVKQARELADQLAKQNIPIGHPHAFAVIPPASQIRGRLLPSSFVQLQTLDAVIRGRSRKETVIEEEDYASRAIRLLLAPRGVPPSMLNHAMAKRFANLIKRLDEASPSKAAVGSGSGEAAVAGSGPVIRPSRATRLADLLAFVCIQKPFLKMDVEGFEPFVLKGLSKTIANPATRPLLILTESWRSDELVRQGTRMIEEFNYVGVTVEVESWSRGKREMHLLTTVDDVKALNNQLLGTDMNTIVWVQKGYEDFMPQLAASARASTKQIN